MLAVHYDGLHQKLKRLDLDNLHTMDTLTVSAAEIRLIHGRTVPLACIDGRWHVIDTKPSLLLLGVAVAVPIDEQERDDWQTQPRLTVTLPPDPASGRTFALVIEDATDDMAVVELARRFNELVKKGEALPGPLRFH